MRYSEIADGVVLRDEAGNKVCTSSYAAKKGIVQVFLSILRLPRALMHNLELLFSFAYQVIASRNAMMAPGMLIMPFIMKRMEKVPWFARLKVVHMPFQVNIE